MPKQQPSACGLAALVRGIVVLLTSTPNEVPEVVGPASWTFRDRPFFSVNALGLLRKGGPLRAVACNWICSSDVIWRQRIPGSVELSPSFDRA